MGYNPGQDDEVPDPPENAREAREMVARANRILDAVGRSDVMDDAAVFGKVSQAQYWLSGAYNELPDPDDVAE